MLGLSSPCTSWSHPVNNPWLSCRAAQKRKPADAQQATAAKRVKVEAPEAPPANGHPANNTPGQHLEQPQQQPAPQVTAVQNISRGPSWMRSCEGVLCGPDPVIATGALLPAA